MGFLKGIGRLLQGKPAFVVPTQQSDVRTDTVDANKTPVDEHGYKIVPSIKVEHCKTHVDGTAARVTAWVTNEADGDIELDKSVILDRTTQFNRFLRPGEAHEMTLYEGEAPTTDHAHKASLYYRLVRSDDYFCAEYRVEYHRESDGICRVVDLHPDYPVRDV